MGLLLVVMVHSAGIQDRDGAKQLLEWAYSHLPRLWTIFADSAYIGAWYAWVDYLWREGLGWQCRFFMEIVRRISGVAGFYVLPKRWIVERTFAWLIQCRRLSKDYEELPATSEALIYVAMIRLMVRRLART